LFSLTDSIFTMFSCSACVLFVIGALQIFADNDAGDWFDSLIGCCLHDKYVGSFNQFHHTVFACSRCSKISPVSTFFDAVSRWLILM